MARLVFQDYGGEVRSVELRPGLNRIGRGSFSDLLIDHASVSNVHCEVVVEAGGMTVRDLGSSNGTYVDGERVRYGPLHVGQKLLVGRVAIAVEETEMRVTIPEFRAPAVPPVLKTPTGKDVCINHDNRQAMWQCTRCSHRLCTACIHRMRRRGGKTLYLCPDCSGMCEVLPEFSQQKKASWFGTLKEKMKMTRLIRGRKKKE